MTSIADAAGAALLAGHFKGKLEGFRSRWKVSLRDVRSALGYSAGDVLQCLCWMIAFAVITLIRRFHQLGENQLMRLQRGDSSCGLKATVGHRSLRCGIISFVRR